MYDYQNVLKPLVLLALALTVIGCEATQGPSPTDQAQTHYQRGDYARAQTSAARAAATAGGSQRDLANYMAGMSAYKLDNFSLAERYLRVAAGSRDEAMAADAQSTLGLIYSQQGRYSQAAQMFQYSAKHQSGEDRAQAYFYAGIALQKLGRWPQARTSLLLAKKNTRDAHLTQRINTQLAVTGYTVQVGAFTSRANADKAAAQYAAKAAQAKLGTVLVVPSTGTNGRSVNLVQVGRYATFSAASSARQKLGDAGALVVPLKP